MPGNKTTPRGRRSGVIQSQKTDRSLRRTVAPDVSGKIPKIGIGIAGKRRLFIFLFDFLHIFAYIFTYYHISCQLKKRNHGIKNHAS